MTREEIILEALIEAKRSYVENITAKDSDHWFGMCYHIEAAIIELNYTEELEYDSWCPYEKLGDIIEGFNPVYLEASELDTNLYWWPEDESEPRIAAFDKLIADYGG